MIGKVYLLRGEPVMVLARAEWLKGTPRNVLILLADGTQTIRPFRGLRIPLAPSPDAGKRSTTALTMEAASQPPGKRGVGATTPGHESKLPVPGPPPGGEVGE